MIIKNLTWLLLLSGVFSYQQNQFKVIFERVEVVSFNTSYIEFATSHNFKYNRTHSATVISSKVKVALGNEIKVELQAYKMASNEYREFPIRFMFDYCQFAATGEGGLDGLYSCGNSTGCPFKAGKYTSCVWAPNSNKFPPNIPGGKYMVDLKMFFRNVEIMFFQGYITIKYPECAGCWF